MARAVRFDNYGDVDVLYVAEDLAEPAPGPHEIVVQVSAAPVNPGEIMIREGAMAEQFPATFPSGQGSDFAGRVHSFGPDVVGWEVGDEVFGWSDNRDAQADFVVVPDTQLTTRPEAADPEQVASLHVAGCTAYGLVHAIAPQSGETIVVTGATGGVGTAVVQLLRREDVRVLAVAGTANDDWLRSVGAEPIHYGDGLGHRLNQAAPEGIDAVVDTYGGGYVELLHGLGVPAARIATCIDFDGAERFGAQVVWGDTYTSTGVLAELAELVADGDLVFPVAARYPLEQVREAYTDLAKRHTLGKIVLTLRTV